MNKKRDLIEALDRIIRGVGYFQEEAEDVENALKALTIINEKDVDGGLLKRCDYYFEYNNAIEYELIYTAIDEKTFKFLKGVLLND